MHTITHPACFHPGSHRGLEQAHRLTRVSLCRRDVYRTSSKCYADNAVLAVLTSHSLRGWGGTAQNTWCVSPIVGDYVLHSTTTHSGTFAALLPVVIAWWASSDLPFFTPASAPVLPTWRIERYESSVAARSRSAVATSTAATNPTSSNGSTPKSESNASSTEHNGAGLSPGTKAGIAVGIVIAVLIVLVVGFLVLRQRRRRTTNEESPTLQRRERKRPYLDSKSELPASAKSKQTTVGAAELGPKSPQELHADTEPQELAASQEDPLPPPIPLASKPRFEGSGGN